MGNFTPLKPLQTPVLFVIFNRPETTKVVFEAIRKARPPRLYVAADGPHSLVPRDRERCQQTRQIVNAVDWDCEVKTLFRDENLGCGKGVSSAITWFFEHESEGIILEDDCLPAESFFWYCEELLERYRDDNRVMHIGANNFLKGWCNEVYSYYFSRNGHVWGWATWRRAWKLYDYNITQYESLKEKGFFDTFFVSRFEKLYRLRIFDRTALNRGRVTYWAYQWDFCRFINSGLSVVPRNNLVRNIGFGGDSTHTKNRKSADANLGVNEIDIPLSHPPFVIRDMESDKRYFSIFIKDRVKNKLNALLP